MPPGLPPKTSFPLAVDSDRTLFLVYNTSEARTTSDNSAWAEEVPVEPVGDDEREIWADNGFANISGELFYYDAVEKTAPVGSGFEIGNVVVDENGKIVSIKVKEGGSGYKLPTVFVEGSGGGAKADAIVEDGAITGFDIVNGGIGYSSSSVGLVFHGKVNKLKRCARGIGGKRTKFNKAGTWVRGFVIAEHHNQLVSAAVATEDYIFELEDDLDLLESEPVCSDDSCVTADFDIRVVSGSGDPCVGTTIEYTLSINGAFNTFTLDFGDGQSTSSAQSGTHTYAPDAIIDPVAFVTSNDCTVIVTPTSRSEGKIPETRTTPTFTLPIPPPPTFPTLTIPTFDCPVSPIELPQIIFPCLNVSPISQSPISVVVEIPVISMVPPTFGPVGPATFTFGPAPLVTPATFTFGPAPLVTPATFTFGPAPSLVPATFTFGHAPSIVPATFTFGPAPFVTPSITFGPLPSLTTSITFGPAPSLVTSITFGHVPSIVTSITFGPIPSITPSINFGPIPHITPSINFGPIPYITPSINFGPIPYITPSINFGPAPSITTIIDFGPAPKLSKIEFGPAPNLSKIEFGPAPKMSKIEFGPAPNLSKIEFGPAPKMSKIEFGPAPNLSKITFGPAPSLSKVEFGNAPEIPSVITFGPVDFPLSKINFGTPPMISVDWGSPPTLSCTVTVECGTSSPSPSPYFRRTLNDSFVDEFNTEDFEIEIGDLGIPSEIKVVAPKFPDIKVQHDIPEFVNVVSDIPSRITMYQADVLPSEIRILSEDVPRSILLDSSEVPKSIRIDAESIPGVISLVNVDVPSVIRVDGSEIPDVIKVVGIPDVIEVRMPSEIVAKLEIPENLEIPLVYKGGPVPIQFDASSLAGGDDQACFALVPCNKK